MLKEVKQNKTWTKAVYKSVKPICKTAISHNKTATPIPVYNNNTINTEPF
tara:strand:- start:671 stop:820 length:150 start_codon:yes stop_codon:yes gene_type:complete